MSHLAIFALGPLHIELDGQPLETSRHKALALLVYLSMQPEKQTREALSAFLWPEYEQEKAFAYLRRTVWELHSLLGEGWLDVDREKIGFHPAADLSLDVTKFQAHLVAFNRHKHPVSTVCPECVENLHKAALLYRGDFLSGFSLRDSSSFDDWQFFQQEALRRDYAEALQKLASLLFQEGLFTQSITFARRWLALDMLNEKAHCLLMKIYARNGQRHIAIRQYQECERLLQTELRVTPESATTTLYEAIVSGNYPQGDEIPQIGSESWRHNIVEAGLVADWLDETISVRAKRAAGSLPTASMPFIGRQQELDHIESLLSEPDCWLLTLLGPGGIGKTRLAIEAGRNQIEHFPHGVLFISLSMVENERSIVPAIARALGLTFRQNGPPPEEQLFDFLREKCLLLILDSFEGLVSCANWLVEVHSHAAGVKLLVTSRHRLLLQGEWVLEVKGLDYPQDKTERMDAALSEAIRDYSAVELFLQAARRTQITFQATPEDLLAIRRITQILEGMPLGLELAATWMNTLSCQEIADEISRGLDILETSLGDISERQRSMRAVFDHSWNLMSDREQILLSRLTVFQRSFSRQAAEQVAGIAVRELSGLIDKSLVQRAPRGRFGLHDLLRQYSTEKLERLPADSRETRRRHCAYYCARLMRWNEELSGMQQGQTLREMEGELENLQTAWEWAVAQRQLEYVEQAMDGLCMFYLRRAHFTEGHDTCQKALEAIQNLTSLDDKSQRIRLSARLLTWQAALSLNLEHFEEAGQLLLQSQRILDEPQLDPQPMIQERTFMLIIRALLASLRLDTPAMFADYEQALQLSQQGNGKSPRFLIYIWRFLMGGAVSKELYLQMEKRLADVRRCGDPFELGCHLFVLGVVELYHWYRLEKAELLLTESMRNFQGVEDPPTEVMIFKTLGYLLSVQGEFEESLALKQRELEIVQDIGDRRMIGIARAEIGEIYCHLGNYGQAEVHIRAAMELLRDRNDYEYALRHRYLGDALLVQGKYTEAREAYQFSFRFFQCKNEKGWMLTALTGLSRAESALGNRASAWAHARQALQLYGEVQLFTFFAYLSVAEIALLLADRGDVNQALELYGLVLQQGYLAQSRWFADLFGQFIDQAASSLSLEEQAAAKTRGQALDFFRTTVRLLDSITKSDSGSI